MAALKRRNSNFAEQSDEEENGTSKNQDGEALRVFEPRGRGDGGLLLTDPKRMQNDIAMLRTAISKGWLIRRKTMIRRRLEKALESATQNMDHEDPKIAMQATKLVIEGGKALAMMDGQDIKRYETLMEEKAPTQTGNTFYGNVTINSTVDQRRTALDLLADRYRNGEVVLDDSATLPAIGEKSDSVLHGTDDRSEP